MSLFKICRFNRGILWTTGYNDLSLSLISLCHSFLSGIYFSLVFIIPCYKYLCFSTTKLACHNSPHNLVICWKSIPKLAVVDRPLYQQTCEISTMTKTTDETRRGSQGIENVFCKLGNLLSPPLALSIGFNKVRLMTRSQLKSRLHSTSRFTTERSY